MTRLPRTTDDLRGLRAARWIRESTVGQWDKNGPEAQRKLQDDSMRRLGLVDTGVAWEPAQSGATVYRSLAMADMLDAARASRFDVLVVAYTARWQRNLRQTLNVLEDQLHPIGVAVWFVDEEILSSNDKHWDALVDAAKGDESWLRRHRKRVTEGYEAKFLARNDPGGNPPLGFRRVDGRMEPDPGAIARAVAVFTRYAIGTVSFVDLEGETGIDREALKVMIRNPIYNGWVRRHPGRPDEQTLPAAWRDDPPVSDELWARVQRVREERYHGGGHPTPVHVHLLTARVFCPCGERIRSEGHKGGRRYRHYRPCREWTRSTVPSQRLEGPIDAQVRGMALQHWQLASLRRLAASGGEPASVVSMRRHQVERDLEDLGRRHGRRLISDDAYLLEHRRLLGMLDQEPAARSAYASPDEALQVLRDLRSSWVEGTEEERRDVVAALYQRITATNERIVDVELTPDAIRHGFLWAMPETVMLEARPEGNGTPLTIPIKGRQAWLKSIDQAS